jgi:hypothetical protein
VYATHDEAKADVFDYVERFYNPRRRHSTLGYLSPVEYENATAQLGTMSMNAGKPTAFSGSKVVPEGIESRFGWNNHARAIHRWHGDSTNGKNLIPSNDRREVEKWEGALEQLSSRLVVDRGYLCCYLTHLQVPTLC